MLAHPTLAAPAVGEAEGQSSLPVPELFKSTVTYLPTVAGLRVSCQLACLWPAAAVVEAQSGWWRHELLEGVRLIQGEALLPKPPGSLRFLFFRRGTEECDSIPWTSASRAKLSVPSRKAFSLSSCHVQMPTECWMTFRQAMSQNTISFH